MSDTDQTRRLQPTTTVLRYRTYNGHLDLHHLEKVAALIAGDLPGNHIRRMTYDGTELMIELES